MLYDSKNPGGYQIITYYGIISEGETYTLPDEVIEQCKSRKPIIFQVIDPAGEGDLSGAIFYQFLAVGEDNVVQLESYTCSLGTRKTMSIKQLLINLTEKTMILNTAMIQIGA